MSVKMRGLNVIRSGGAPTSARATKVQDETQDEVKEQEPPTDGRLATLEVNFSTFNSWYEINSMWEGRFIERTIPGAFRKTIAERGQQVKVLFNHGMDLNIGDKVLSTPEVIEERRDSPYLEGPLFDTSYNRDLLPGLAAGAYGSSFMFEVLNEVWDYEPERSDYNPEALPERSIMEVRLHEAGPVTWPANPASTAGVRSAGSGADWFGEQLSRRDPQRHQELLRSHQAFRAMHGLAAPASPAPEQGRHVSGLSSSARRRRLVMIDLGSAS